MAAEIRETKGGKGNKRDHNLLSYSSSQLLQGCQTKYYFTKVVKLPPDPDSEDSRLAMDMGTIFHAILEENNHEVEGVEIQSLEKYFKAEGLGKEINFEEHGPLMVAMLQKYKKLHKEQGLKAIACEVEVIDEKFIGYIDVLMHDPKNGDWFIVDLKTSGRFDPKIAARLPSDPQLNLYAYYSAALAEKFNLPLSKYRGALYRVTTKTTTKKKDGETFMAYSKRLEKSVDSYQITVPHELMAPEETRDNFLRMYQLKEDIRTGAVKPSKNLSFCDSYFRPCQFWSKCHGKLHGQMAGQLDIRTS